MTAGTPKWIGRFKIQSVVASGGMGTVYRAEDPEDGKVVAVKVLPESFSDRQEFVERFRREARVYLTLSHEMIPRAYHFGMDAGRYFLAMEWIEGADMRTWLARRAGLPGDDEWRGLFAKICEGVAAAHRQGVLHRDLTAGNIIVLADGQIRITDFGLSKMVQEAHFTLTGQILGTPHYSAPEQIDSSKNVTESADIWSLGVLGYQLASGQLPFEGETNPAVIRKILDPRFDPPDVGALNPSLSPRSVSIIRKCLQRRIGARYRQVAEILEDSAGPPGQPVAVSQTPSPARALTPRGIPVMAAGLAVVVVLAALVWGGWRLVSARDAGVSGSASPRPQVPASRISASGAPSVGVSDADPTPAGPVEPRWIESGDTSLVNINEASEKALADLEPLNPYTARQIVILREMAGPFARVDELFMMPGMRPENLEALRSIARAGPPKEALPKRKKININTATEAELKAVFVQLYNVHATNNPWKELAELLDHRQKNGPFKTIEDVANVRGFPTTGKRYWLVSKLATVE
ncbi:MAG: hypothetical protein A3G34_04445 [Candidatus Lindowbacteria bacterium RIFCSPLOWO2_12_FULL_62_27]|nr:MAG: hypothetical protein A3G34_04445 [Candidatus Lindowbacteria bacterium RIFCSPLOWO2_12_FULL_62_27]